MSIRSATPGAGSPFTSNIRPRTISSGRSATSATGRSASGSRSIQPAPYPGASAVMESAYCRADVVRGSSMRNWPEPSQRPSWAVIAPTAVCSSNGRREYFDRTMTITAAPGTGLPAGSSTRPVTVIRAARSAAGGSSAIGTDTGMAVLEVVLAPRCNVASGTSRSRAARRPTVATRRPGARRRRAGSRIANSRPSSCDGRAIASAARAAARGTRVPRAISSRWPA